MRKVFSWGDESKSVLMETRLSSVWCTIHAVYSQLLIGLFVSFGLRGRVNKFFCLVHFALEPRVNHLNKQLKLNVAIKQFRR